jgi:hypothetical protein
MKGLGTNEQRDAFLGESDAARRNHCQLGTTGRRSSCLGPWAHRNRYLKVGKYSNPRQRLPRFAQNSLRSRLRRWRDLHIIQLGRSGSPETPMQEADLRESNSMHRTGWSSSAALCWIARDEDATDRRIAGSADRPPAWNESNQWVLLIRNHSTDCGSTPPTTHLEQRFIRVESTPIHCSSRTGSSDRCGTCRGCSIE